jgi:hypothetical protein
MSAFTKYSDLPPHAEIANLEHELAILQQRRADMDRSAKMRARVLAIAFGGGAILWFIYAIVSDNSDATAKLFLVLWFATTICLFAVVVEDTTLGKNLGTPNPFVEAYNWSSRSFVQTAIAAREQWLAELKAQQQ